MVCPNSLKRGRCPLGPLLLPERPKSTFRNDWGKFCSIVFNCLLKADSIDGWPLWLELKSFYNYIDMIANVNIFSHLMPKLKVKHPEQKRRWDKTCCDQKAFSAFVLNWFIFVSPNSASKEFRSIFANHVQCLKVLQSLSFFNLLCLSLSLFVAIFLPTSH